MTNTDKKKQIANLQGLLTENDPVTIVITDKKEYLEQQRDALADIGHYLHDDMDLSFGQIYVLIAHDQEKKTSPEEKEMIAGPYMTANCHVQDHDCNAPFMSIGKTRKGNEIGVDPLVVGRKVISLGDALEGIVENSDPEALQEARKLIAPVYSVRLS